MDSHASRRHIIQTLFSRSRYPVITHKITGEIRPFKYEEFLDLIENHGSYSIFRDEYTEYYLHTGKSRKLTPKEQFKLHEVIWRTVGVMGY